jgi:hypothetical protein
MSVNDFAAKDPSAELNWEFNFAAELPSATNVVSITATAPPGLTIEQQTPDLPNARSIVRISGGAHGQIYEVRAIAVLTNQEEIPGTLTLRVFRGA